LSRNNAKVKIPEQLKFGGEGINVGGATGTYNLKGVVLQSGSLYKGHYRALVKHGETWYLCNDHDVKPRGDEEAKEKVPSLDKEAYILFYEKEE